MGYNIWLIVMFINIYNHNCIHRNQWSTNRTRLTHTVHPFLHALVVMQVLTMQPRNSLTIFDIGQANNTFAVATVVGIQACIPNNVDPTNMKVHSPIIATMTMNVCLNIEQSATWASPKSILGVHGDVLLKIVTSNFVTKITKSTKCNILVQHSRTKIVLS